MQFLRSADPNAEASRRAALRSVLVFPISGEQKLEASRPTAFQTAAAAAAAALSAIFLQLA